MKWEYAVASVQQARVTWVNGAWNGERALDEEHDEEKLFASCPHVWDFLNEAGADGWELVGSNVQQASEGPPLTTLYLMRAAS